MKPILSIGVFLISVGLLLIIILIGVTNLVPGHNNDLSVTQTAIAAAANDLNQQQTGLPVHYQTRLAVTRNYTYLFGVQMACCIIRC